MKFQCWSIGRADEPYVRPGVDLFTKRVSGYFATEWRIIPPPKNAGLLGEADLRKKEGELVLGMLSKDDYLVALDERGKLLTSPALAAFIQARANESTRQVVFLVGGAYGLHPAVLERAAFRWSLSTLTFPHQLVRLILAEQLYRACSILRNEKYHHQ